MSTDRGWLQRSRLRFHDEALDQVPVHMGEVRVAGNRSLLFCVGLGSCVAVALYDAETHIGGIAHAMLPRPESGRSGGSRSRFVSNAVPQLIALLEGAGAAVERLRARLAGGAAMFPDLLDREALHLGRRNVEAAREALGEAGIPIDGEDVLGTHGRSVFLRTTDGLLLVSAVAHDDIVL